MRGIAAAGWGSRGRRAVAAFLAAAFLASAAAGAQDEPPVVDRVAVVVEGESARDRAAQVATLWDLFVLANLEIIRASGADSPQVSVDVEAIRGAQALAVEQLIALREAVRLGRDAAPVDLVDEARDALAERIGGHDRLWAFLRDRAISTSFLDAALRREVIVARFTRDSVRLPVPDLPEQVRAQFDAGGHPFEGQAFEDVRPAFEAWLRGQQLERLRQVWLMDLRSRCRLLIFDVYGDLVPASAAGGG